MQVWIDQKKWKVYPNQSVMFVGPSGVGKDTIINHVTKEIEKFGVVPILGGKTMEGINLRLQRLGSLAAAYIPAGELSSFFGNRDYQQGMIQEFTDLLSGGDKKDISTKGDLFNNGGKPLYIYKPTITLHGGSTEEWLHKAMPDGTMEGGFLGRFLIVVEKFGSKFVPLIKQSLSKQESVALDTLENEWNAGVQNILAHYVRPCEMRLLEDAQHAYTNWYHNRFKYFSKTVLPYANRSRDMVLRLGILMAVSRSHWNWMDEEDVRFGCEVLQEIGKEIDKVILPPTNEAQAGQMLMAMLPASSAEIWKALGRKFPLRVLQAAEQLLAGSGQIYRESGLWKRKG
jgi:energy-coupling factor transporter ATP-binding protein EcfA2